MQLLDVCTNVVTHLYHWYVTSTTIANQPGYTFDPVARRWKKDGFSADTSRALSSIPKPEKHATRDIYEQGIGQMFWVEDSWGDGSDLVGGQLDDEARFVFRNGQCLALAVELAKAAGTNMVAIWVDETEEASYDPETSEALFDKDGNPIPLVYDAIIHAHAIASDGKLYDIDGDLNEEDVVMVGLDSQPNGRLIKLSTDEAIDKFEDYMTQQRYEFARTFVTSILPEELIVA